MNNLINPPESQTPPPEKKLFFSWQEKLRKLPEPDFQEILRSAESRITASDSVQLGSIAKSASRTNKRQQNRAKKYLLLSEIRQLLRAYGKKLFPEMPTRIHRTSLCLSAMARNSEAVGVHLHNDTGNAFFSGLQTCGSVWACPVCASKIQERRRAEVAQGMDYMLKRHEAVMLTFTFPHTSKQPLDEQLRLFQAALRHFRSGGAWQKTKKKIGFDSLIRSLEITYGANGWHSHTHELWFVSKRQGSKKAVRGWRGDVVERWIKSLIHVGLVAADDSKKHDQIRRHGVDFKAKARCGDYLAKQDSTASWGIDSELARGSSKIGKRSGVHPFQLAATHENHHLFFEYVLATKGRAQLYWTPQLKKRCGIGELDDKALAEQHEEAAQDFDYIEAGTWRIVAAQNEQARVLDAAETQCLQHFRGVLHDIVSEYWQHKTAPPSEEISFIERVRRLKEPPLPVTTFTMSRVPYM